MSIRAKHILAQHDAVLNLAELEHLIGNEVEKTIYY